MRIELLTTSINKKKYSYYIENAGTDDNIEINKNSFLFYDKRRPEFIFYSFKVNAKEKVLLTGILIPESYLLIKKILDSEHKKSELLERYLEMT